MGPTLFVYLPRSLFESEVEGLHEWLSRDSHLLAREGNDWDFMLETGTCRCSLALVPFGAEAAGDGQATDVYMEEAEQEQYERVLGYRPAITAQLDNYCRGDRSGHKALAELAAGLAGRYSGVIDLGGAIGELEESVKAGLPGRCDSLMYIEGERHHLVDAVFMRAWVKHPGFHLEI